MSKPSKAAPSATHARIAHLNVEDDPTTGGCAVRALYIGGYNPASAAHQLLRRTVAFLDQELAQLQEPLESLHHQDGTRTTIVPSV